MDANSFNLCEDNLLLDKREEMYSKLVPFLPENEREMFVSAFEGIGGAKKFLHGQEEIRVLSYLRTGSAPRGFRNI